MTDQTAGSADASGDSGTDYQARYNGLNAAFQRRTNEWNAEKVQFESQIADLQSKADKVAEYEARDAAAREEAEALAQFNALKERFSTEPPAPQNPNEQNRLAWDDARYARRPERERSDDNRAW